MTVCNVKMLTCVNKPTDNKDPALHFQVLPALQHRAALIASFCLQQADVVEEGASIGSAHPLQNKSLPTLSLAVEHRAGWEADISLHSWWRTNQSSKKP